MNGKTNGMRCDSFFFFHSNTSGEIMGRNMGYSQNVFIDSDMVYHSEHKSVSLFSESFPYL